MSPSSATAAPARVLALDIDGVVVHPALEVGSGHWSVDLEADLGVSPTRLSTSFFQKHWPRVVVGKADLEERLSIALDEIGSDVDPRVLMNYWFQKDGRLDTRVAEFAVNWRAKGARRRLVAFTNQERNRLEYLQHTLGLGRIFDEMFWSGDVGCSKKQPSFFELAIARMRAHPADIIFYDDEQSVVDVATSCGVDAHLFIGLDDMRATLNGFDSTSSV